MPVHGVASDTQDSTGGRQVSVWREVGDLVFVRRYPFFDSNVGAVVGEDGVLIVDTRTSHRQAEEIRRELRQVTALPVTRVVNTHMHFDHTFGNAPFRPAELWGHERCAAALRDLGERQRAAAIQEFPEMADELREVEIVPPDHTLTDRATISIGGRSVELRYLGRGHTDNDILVVIPDAAVLFAGDLLENDAPPWFGDSFPLDWPSTVEGALGLVGAAVVPGHGGVGDRAFVERQLGELRAIASLARQVHTGEAGLDDAVAVSPFPPGPTRIALERGLAQLRGESGPDRP